MEPTKGASTAQGSLEAARRQADAIAAEANRKLQTLSLGATPTQVAPRPAGGGAAASPVRSPIRDLMYQESAEMRLAMPIAVQQLLVSTAHWPALPASPLLALMRRPNTPCRRATTGAPPRVLSKIME